MRTKLVLFACLLMSAFASAQSAYITQQAQLACGDPSVKFNVVRAHGHPLLTPTKDTAVVYILEPGFAPHPQTGTPLFEFINRIGLDGKWVGATGMGSYLAFQVPTGVHHLCMRGQSWVMGTINLVSLLQLNAKPGATYYFLTALGQLDPDEAQLQLAWSVPATSTVRAIE